MAEVRARGRGKGQPVFSAGDLSEYLTAFAAPNPPHLASTIAVLEEILIDFIIETCHAAQLCASYSRRQKIKVDDFKWVLRRDERLLGRVQEQQWRDKKMKEERKGIDVEKLGGEGGGVDLAVLAGGVAVVNRDKSDAGGKRKGNKKRKAGDDVHSAAGKRARV